MKKYLIPFNLFCLCFVLSICFIGCSNEDAPASGVDSRFVGVWERDESVSGVVEQVYTLVLNANGTASYSWYRHSNTVSDSEHDSNGTWRYDEAANRIITDCTTSTVGSTVILDVINVTSTTLVVKQEGTNKSKTYIKK